MIISAGQETIQAIGIIQGQGGVQGVMCETVQITFPSMPTQAQVQALMDGAVADDGRELAGYDGLAEVRITLYRQPQDARDRAMQEMTAEVERRAEAERLAQAQATQAAQEAQAAQEQAEAKTALLMTVAEALPDEVAVKHPEIYPALKRDGSAVAADTRINWRGKVAKAKVTLWDREDQDPDNAPELWDILTFGGSGYRVIPETITTELAFAEGEIGYWPPDGKHYRAVRNGVVHNPAVYPLDWEEVEV